MPAPTRPSEYLLLLRQPQGGVPPPEELQKIMAKFARWMNGLRRQGMVRGTNGLGLDGKVLRRRKGRLSTTDGPYVEAKEVVGGYVLISAPNLRAALQAARTCPGLDYNMAVELRPVQPPGITAGSK